MSFGLKILIFNSGRLQISRYISLVATYLVVQEPTRSEDGHISKTEKAKLYDMKGFIRRCHTCRLLPVCTICVQNRMDHGFCKNALTQEEADPQLRMRLKILTEDNIYC